MTRVRGPKPEVVVVGAGAFGGWTALELARRGASVTVVDAWEPGHARSSSGGTTRVIRASYGSRRIYTQMAKQAYPLWERADADWQASLFHRTGGLWMFGEDDGFGRASAASLEAEGLPFEWITPAEATARFPQVSPEGLTAVMVEPDAGYLEASRACRVVMERAIAAGATSARGAVPAPVVVAPDAAPRVKFADGVLEADAVVYACGPWLGQLFPDVVGDAVLPTRQEVYYYGTPAGDARFGAGELPVWVEFADRLIYGIPDDMRRGFKVADDTSGDRIDPTSGSRELDPAKVSAVRERLARRFPAMTDAPLVAGEVCQYEATPDSDFILDHHPANDRVWIAGGGSGHGFKMGPVIGEIMADAVLGRARPDPMFRLDRFDRRGVAPTLKEKWS